MEKNPQEERFEFSKKRALSTKLFLRLFVLRNFIGYFFLILGVLFVFLEMDSQIGKYEAFYKIHFEETRATKAAPIGMRSNYTETLNGKAELIFSYSFIAENGNVYTGIYKTFDYDSLNKKEFALIYNVKEPEFSKVLNGDENFVLEFFRLFGHFLFFLLVGPFLTVWGLRISSKERKLLLKGDLVRGVLVKFRKELIYEFKAKDGKTYECKTHTRVPPSCLAFSCRNREKNFDLDLFKLAFTCQSKEEDLNLKLFTKEDVSVAVRFEAHVLYLPEKPSYNCLFALIPGEPQLDQFGVFR